MDIRINGEPADVRLENEKTVRDLLAGIEDWLEGTGNRISGLVIDGLAILADDVERALDQELNAVQSIDIQIRQWMVFAVESLIAAKNALQMYEDAPFADKKLVKEDFEASAAFRFLADQIQDMAHTVSASLADEGLPRSGAIRLIDERIREIESPKQEILNCNALASEIVSRLEDLPLDMQTGKDKRAQETMRLFSQIAEKLFRLLALLKQHGFATDDLCIDSVPLGQFIDGFSDALRELLKAYEAKDAVLAGDFAEYEMAPRLAALYSALKNI
jgi:hypothetical protein